MTEPIAIVPPRVAFLDPRTGDISRQWYLLILAIVNRLGGNTGASTDDLGLGVLAGNTTASLDAMIQSLESQVGVLPVQPSAERMYDDMRPALDFRIDDNVAPTYSYGTLADQNADRVAINGGAINATPIGATTASTGRFTTLTSGGGATFLVTSAALANGAAAAAGTITNAPVAGNPTKWIGINDNGTVRYIPAW